MYVFTASFSFQLNKEKCSRDKKDFIITIPTFLKNIEISQTKAEIFWYLFW